MRNLFSTLRALMALLFLCTAGSVWGDTYDIVFKTGSSSKSLTTSTKSTDAISSGTDYVTETPFITCTKAYYNETNGLRLGTSSDYATVEIQIASAFTSNIKKITLKTVKYSGEQPKLSLYAGTKSLKTGISAGSNYTHVFQNDTSFSSIKIVTTTNKKRVYVPEIIIESSTSTSKYNVTIDPSITGGTVTATPATDIVEGKSVTLTNEPNVGYTFSSYTVTNNTTQEGVTVSDEGNFTMPASDVTVSATFTAIPQHTITWRVNGKSLSPETSTFYEGDAIEYPNVPESYIPEGYVLMGWVTSPIVDEVTSKPTKIQTPPTYASATMGSTDATYYAVFAVATGDPTTYSKATSADFKDGQNIIIVNSSKAMSSTSTGTSNQNLDDPAVTVNNSTITPSGLVLSTAVWTLEKSGTQYYAKHGDGYLYAASSLLKCSTTETEKQLWNITLSNNQYTFTTDSYEIKYDNGTFKSVSKVATPSSIHLMDIYIPNVTYSDYCTSTNNKYTVTITQPEEGGTITVKNGEVEVNDGDMVDDGTTLEIILTPVEHYELDSWTANDIIQSGTSYKIDSKDVTFAATFKILPSHTVTWYVNRETNVKLAETYYKGESINFSAPVAVPEGFVFMGWIDYHIDGVQQSAPDYITNVKMGEKDLEYVAVFARRNEDTSSKTTYTLNNPEEAVESYISGTAYDNENNPWAYVCHLNNTSGQTSYQLTHQVKNVDDRYQFTYLATPKFDGSITNITFTITNPAYEEGEKRYVLFCSSKMADAESSSDMLTESDGDIANYLIPTDYKGEEISVNLDGVHQQVFIYTAISSTSTKAVLQFYNISVTVGGALYSDYCTEIPTQGSFTITKSCWGTYYTGEKFKMPENVVGYTVTLEGQEGEVEKLTLSKSYPAESIVPPLTPLLLQSLEDLDVQGISKTYEYEIITDESQEGKVYDSNLRGQLHKGMITEESDGKKYYYLKLTYGNSGTYTNLLGWYIGASGGAPFYMNHDKRAYLIVPQDGEVRGFSFDFDSQIETLIKDVDAQSRHQLYDLSGRRLISKPQHGCYIMDGRKYIVK